MTLTERCLYIYKLLLGCETHDQLMSILNLIDNSISKDIFPTYKLETIVEVQMALIDAVNKKREDLVPLPIVN